MKILALLTVGIIVALVSSCATGSRTDPVTGQTTKFCLLGTDAQSVVIDGPPPTVTGYTPTFDKKGKVVGQTPVFGPPQDSSKVPLFAAYGLNQSQGLTKVCGVITNSVASLVIGSVLKAYDDNATSVDKDAIAAASKKDSEAASLKLTQANNTHAETMAGMEMEAAPASIPTPAPTP